MNDKIMLGSSKLEELYSTLIIVLLAVLGIAVVLLLPLLVGSMVDYFGVTEREAGFVATAEMTGGVVGTLILSLVLQKWKWRPMTFSALLFLTASNFLTIYFNDFVSLCGIRFVSGVAEGVILVMAYSAVARIRDQERAWSYIAFGWYAYSVLAFYLLPLIFERWGGQGGYIVLALSNLIVLPFLRWFPEGGKGKDENVTEVGVDEEVQPMQSWWAVVGVIAALLFYVGMGAVWTYLDRIGVDAGIKVSIISNALIVSSFAGMGGACLAAFLGVRAGRAKPLFCAGIGFMFGIFLLMDVVGVSGFTVAISILQFTWSFMTPYLLGTLTHVDSSGRVIAFATVMQLGGLAVGPFLAALLLADGGYTAVLWLGGMMTVMCLILMGAVISSFERENNGADPVRI